MIGALERRNIVGIVVLAVLSSRSKIPGQVTLAGPVRAPNPLFPRSRLKQRTLAVSPHLVDRPVTAVNLRMSVRVTPSQSHGCTRTLAAVSDRLHCCPAILLFR